MSDWKGTSVYIEVLKDNSIVFQRFNHRLDTDSMIDIFEVFDPSTHIIMIYPSGDAPDITDI